MLNLLPDTAVIRAEKPKRTMLPLLVVLFLISYALLAMLVVEQAHTIDAQRILIHQLFSDSVELFALKGKAYQHNQHVYVGPKSQTQTPSPQVQAPPTKRETPSSQERSGKPAPKEGASKLHRKLPEKPPTDAADVVDERRNPYRI